MNLSSVTSIKWTLPMVVIAILGAGLAFKSCQKPTPTDNLTPPEHKTIDSLKNTQPTFAKTQDSIIHIVVVDTQHAAVSRKAEIAAKASAARAEHRADSIAAIASSMADWKSAYDARTQETVGLKLAVQHADSIAADERDARIKLSTAYGADTLRRVAIEKLNVGLVKTIGELQRPCKIVGPIPCPSRTVTAVLSGIGGAIAGNRVK